MLKKIETLSFTSDLPYISKEKDLVLTSNNSHINLKSYSHHLLGILGGCMKYLKQNQDFLNIPFLKLKKQFCRKPILFSDVFHFKLAIKGNLWTSITNMGWIPSQKF